MMARTGAVLFCVVLCLAAVGATAALAAECAHQAVLLPEAALAGVVVEPESGGKGWLGVSITDITDEVRKKEGLEEGAAGVLVLEVYDESPAEKAGVEGGDVITMAAGAKVEDVAKLVDLISSTAPGKEVTITVVRNGKPATIKVTLAARDTTRRIVVRDLEGLDELEGLKALEALGKLGADIPWVELGLAGTSGRGRLGVYINDLSEGLAEYFGVPEGEGALVEDIVEGSPAEKAGIRAGDIIIKVGDEGVGDTEELKEAIGDMEAGKQTPVVVWREGKQQTLYATVEESEGTRARKAYIRALEGSGDEVRKIHIVETEAAAELKETIDELKAEIEELKAEIRELEKESETD
jgi:S1-C subfamily serine protease